VSAEKVNFSIGFNLNGEPNQRFLLLYRDVWRIDWSIWNTRRVLYGSII